MNAQDINSDDEIRRQWTITPRRGLLTSEIDKIIGIPGEQIRESIRIGELTGVALKHKGIIYAYGVTIENIVTFYSLTPEVVESLRKLAKKDITGESSQLGIPYIYSGIQIELPYEFKTKEEFEHHNNAK